jgi:hypothetical protein
MRRDQVVMKPITAEIGDWLSRRLSGRKIAREMDALLQVASTYWSQADHATKLQAAELMIELLQRIMPNYRFAENFHGQFYFWAKALPSQLLAQSAKHFGNVAADAKKAQPALFIAMSVIACNLALMRVIRHAGPMYTQHSRTANDVIQYSLYHRALAAQKERGTPKAPHPFGGLKGCTIS